LVSPLAVDKEKSTNIPSLKIRTNFLVVSSVPAENQFTTGT
jgi:hypothetical protein